MGADVVGRKESAVDIVKRNGTARRLDAERLALGKIATVGRPDPPCLVRAHLTSGDLYRSIFRERLERDDGKRILHPRKGLQSFSHKPADIDRLRQIAFHQQIELTRGRIDLRYLLD